MNPSVSEVFRDTFILAPCWYSRKESTMKKRNNATRIVFLVISVLLLLSMILGFVSALFPGA